jgi:hypothetical protein
MSKQCKTCKISKDINDFYFTGYDKIHRQTKCKECSNKAIKERRQLNKKVLGFAALPETIRQSIIADLKAKVPISKIKYPGITANKLYIWRSRGTIPELDVL